MKKERRTDYICGGEIFHVAYCIFFLPHKGVCPILFVCSQTLITENAENLVCAQRTELNPKQEWSR